MATGNYWVRKAQSDRLSRRRFLGTASAAGAGAAGFALVGCGDDDDDGNGNGNGGSVTPSGTGTATGQPTTPAAGTPVDGSHYISTGATDLFTTVDNHRELSPTINNNLALAYSLLVQYDDPNLGTLRGDVATGLPELVDDVTYIFEIHENILTHDRPPADGRVFTAEDVAWNINRQAQRKDFAGNDITDFYRYAQLYEIVDNAEAVDATHVQVTLKRPSAPWLVNMGDGANTMLIPEVAEAIEPRLNDADPQLIVGTGPYMFTQFDPGRRFEAQRFPNYFRKALGENIQHFDSIVFEYLGTDPSPIRTAFAQKQIDQIDIPDEETFTALSDLTGIENAIEVPDPNFNQVITYNYSAPPYNNPQLRQAINLAIDRQTVLNLVYRGIGRLNSGVPWAYTDWALSQEELLDTPGYRTDREADITEARALWEAGGGSEVGDITIWITGTGPTSVDAAEWLPQMLNDALGVGQFRSELLPTASVVNHLYGENFSNLYVGMTQWNSPDPRNRFLDGFGPGGGTNFGKYDNQEVIGLIEQSTQEFEIEAAQGLIQEAQRLLHADGGGGVWQMVGGVRRRMQWPYLHRDHAFVFMYDGILISQGGWIDQNDPSFEGRPGL